jgi:predicted NBD/HSP70 family sugar kinase
LVGQTLATLVSFFNPSLVLLGGKMVDAGDLMLAAVREGTYHGSLPLATRNLKITLSARRPDPGLYRAAFMVRGVRDIMRKLSGLGVRLAIDDFGTGQCSAARSRRAASSPTPASQRLRPAAHRALRDQQENNSWHE